MPASSRAVAPNRQPNQATRTNPNPAGGDQANSWPACQVVGLLTTKRATASRNAAQLPAREDRDEPLSSARTRGPFAAFAGGRAGVPISERVAIDSSARSGACSLSSLPLESSLGRFAPHRKFNESEKGRVFRLGKVASHADFFLAGLSVRQLEVALKQKPGKRKVSGCRCRKV